MAEQKKGLHYAWLIFIGCCCFCAGSIALSLNIAGVFLHPLEHELSLSPSEVSLWIAIAGPSSVVTSPFWGWLIQTKNINVVTTISAVSLIISSLLFAFANSLWMLLAAGIFVGISLPCSFALVSPTLIGNWFDESIRGRMLGIATAFTGVGTFIWSPLFAILIQNIGLQATYLLNAALAAILLLPFSLFIFKFKPEDKGLKPYGYKAEAGDAATANTVKPNDVGAKISTALKSSAFWFMLIAVGFTTLGMGFNHSQPRLASEFLGAVMEPNALALFGATMISVAAVGNILGKIVFGVMIDKLGLKPTFVIFYLMFAAGFIFWLYLHNQPGMLIGAFLFGTHNAIFSVGYPLIARKIFGSKNFSRLYSFLSMAGQFVGGFGASSIAFTFEVTGSYSFALYLGIALVAVVGFGALMAITRIGKVKFDEGVA